MDPSNKQSVHALVNVAHPQQDVYGRRRERTNHMRFRYAQQLLPSAKAGMQALEVGGGMAEFSSVLIERNWQVCFTDINPHNVENAGNLGLEAYQMDFNLGLPVLDDGRFDLIVMLEVIEHIVNAEYLLSEIKRVLKPHGVLILSTPNFAWWRNRLRILLGGLSHDEGYHYRFFTKHSLTRQLKEADLTPELWRFTSAAYGVNWLRRVVLKKGRMHLLVPNVWGPLLGQTLFVRARVEK